MHFYYNLPLTTEKKFTGFDKKFTDLYTGSIQWSRPFNHFDIGEIENIHSDPVMIPERSNVIQEEHF